MNECQICEGPVELLNETREIRIGKRAVAVLHEFYKCGECGGEFFTPDQMDSVQRRASAQIREEEGLLKPDEIRAVRDKLGLSQEAFEQLIGVGPKTVGRWERGTVFQNRSTDILLRVVDRFPEVIRFLAGRHGVLIPGGSPEPASPRGLVGFGGSPEWSESLMGSPLWRCTRSTDMHLVPPDARSLQVFEIMYHPAGPSPFVVRGEDTFSGTEVPVATVNRIRKTIGI